MDMGGKFFNDVVAVGMAAGKDTTLPALTCVAIRITDHGYTMAATDRYRLHTVSTLVPTHGADYDLLVSAADLVKFAKRNKRHACALTVHAHAITLTAKPLSPNAPEDWTNLPLVTDCEFPTIARLLGDPSGERGVATTVNGKYLGDAMTAASLIGLAEILPIVAAKPVRIMSRAEGSTFRALVMPIRENGSPAAPVHLPHPREALATV